jgi:threonine/homoserine/homoserine lactone efflux protein
VAVFVGVDLLLVLTPGPDVLYVLARGLSQGRRIALTAVGGLCLGYVVHTALGAAGLAAAIRTVPALMPILRYVGAAYLVVLAVRILISLRRSRVTLEQPPGESAATVLRQSFLTSLLNPKGILMYLALIPQFITATAPVGLQLGVLGTVHVVNCALIYTAIAVVAGLVGRRFTRTPRAARRMSAITAVILLAVASVTATAH